MSCPSFIAPTALPPPAAQPTSRAPLSRATSFVGTPAAGAAALHVPCARSPRSTPTCSGTPPGEGGSELDPSSDPAFTPVRAYSFSTCHNNCALLTLIPVSGGPLAFKMSVTAQQAEAIRASLRYRDPRPPPPQPPRLLRRAGPARPSTHDLLASVVAGAGAVVSHAAITHMQGDVFVARLWLRTAGGDTFEVDARPSDALILTARAAAPLYLHGALLRQWGVSVKNIEYDFRQGRCEIVTYADNMRATVDLKQTLLDGKRDVLELAILRSRLDLAVKCQRFAEAAHIQQHLDLLCPVDSLKRDLQKAVEEERFADADRITAEICEWKGKLRLWEKGQIDLHKEYTDKLGSEDSAFMDQAEHYRAEDDRDGTGRTGGHNTFRGFGI